MSERERENIHRAFLHVALPHARALYIHNSTLAPSYVVLLSPPPLSLSRAACLPLCSRTCWVCLATEEDQPGLEWTHPCRCRGTGKWVHQSCLQHWIDEKQRGASSAQVKCPQCQFVYQIRYPDASTLLLLYELANRGITVSSPILLASVMATSLYWVSFTYGVSAASLALGREEFVKVFANPESTWVVFVLPALPWAIFFLKMMRPEVFVLQVWHRVLSPLSYAVLRLFPLTRTAAKEPGPQQHRRYEPTAIAPLQNVSRSVVGTFSLPIISSLLGWALSHFVPLSSLKRTLLVSLCVSSEHLQGSLPF